MVLNGKPGKPDEPVVEPLKSILQIFSRLFSAIFSFDEKKKFFLWFKGYKPTPHLLVVRPLKNLFFVSSLILFYSFLG